ncbi:hypothetical protein [Nocardioides sp. MH1]|uniref:hypothetical protein n=1 Tax=Nocardioides sp. MH1 TaxID=3242490 RepID=UPI00351FF578
MLLEQALQRLADGLNRSLDYSDDEIVTRGSAFALRHVGPQIAPLLDPDEDVEWVIAGKVRSSGREFDTGLIVITTGKVLVSGFTAKLFGKNPTITFKFSRQGAAARAQDAVVLTRPSKLVSIGHGNDHVDFALIPPMDSNTAEVVATLTEGFINGSVRYGEPGAQ